MKCSVEGCDKSLQARGWCSMHYYRWRIHGDPLVVEELNPEDFPRVELGGEAA